MYDTTDVLILAFGWMAIFEGVSPLLFPETWRRAVRELVEQPESALRNFGGRSRRLRALSRVVRSRLIFAEFPADRGETLIH